MNQTKASNKTSLLKVKEKFSKNTSKNKESPEITKLQRETLQLTNQLFSDENFINL